MTPVDDRHGNGPDDGPALGDVLSAGDDDVPRQAPAWLRKVGYVAGALVLVVGAARTVGDPGRHADPLPSPTTDALPAPAPVRVTPSVVAPSPTPSVEAPGNAEPEDAAGNAVHGVLEFDAARVRTTTIEDAEAAVMKLICSRPDRVHRIRQESLLGGLLVTRTYQAFGVIMPFSVSYQYVPRGVSYVLLGTEAACGASLTETR